jgi:hypothetical protein
MSLFSKISGSLDGGLGGLSSAFGKVGLQTPDRLSKPLNDAISKLNKLETGYQQASSIFTALKNGDYLGALKPFLNGGKFGKSGISTGELSGVQDRYWNTPTRLMGGVSPARAQQIYEEMMDVPLASKKLYLIEVTDLMPSGGGGNARIFQMLTTSITYSPVTLGKEKHQIGSAVMDRVSTTEQVDLSLTTLDDQKGTLKRWFEAKGGQVAHADGTVGVPYEYLVKIRILHSFFSDETSRGMGFENNYLMRPVAIEYSKSREDSGMEQLQMSFTQFDTFMPV